jgi:hypothetical protein
VRVHGYCTSCRRVRRVAARDVDVALAAMRHGVPVGVCDACAADAEAERRAR